MDAIIGDLLNLIFGVPIEAASLLDVLSAVIALFTAISVLFG
jgi:hypothetical protein